ncbi:MAG: outer membrane protein assembly factor BamD [Proteobacteria bacterium]|nr:outer membrane protein assembly factor BamD [Pseudomonadota bacterium]
MKRLLSGLLALFLASCADDSEKFDEMSVEQLYLMAVDRMEAKKHKEAGLAYAEVERQHPYSDWSLNAQVMAGYAYYLAKKYEDAEESFETFIQLHPGHEYVPYAMYMLGLISYEQIPIVERDQTPAKESADAFQKLINRFPDSKYAKDGRLKIDLIRDHLAAKEVEVARYYQQKEAHLAAVNRLKLVVKEYEKSAHVPEALYRLVISYLAIGLYDEAQASAAVLGHNYSDSDWYSLAYEAMQGVKR